MLKQCTGSKTKTGCMEIKLREEFSGSYPNMCRECENKYKRINYQKAAHPQTDNPEFAELLSKPWR